MGTIASGRRTDGPSLVERFKNWVKALFSSSQETVLPPTSGTAASALEGVPTFVPLLQQIDALNESIHALESGGVETNDKGGVLKNGEKTIRRNGKAIDNAANK